MGRCGAWNSATDPPLSPGALGTTGLACPCCALFCPVAAVAEIMETAPVIAKPFKNVRRLSQPSTLVFNREPFTPCLRELVGNLREWPARVLGGEHHLLYFNLFHIEWKFVGYARLRVVELDGSFI